jgi:hypothetical protein
MKQLQNESEKSNGYFGAKSVMSYFRKSSSSSSSGRLTKQERELKDKVFELTNRLGNFERLNETMKESHKIVLDTKESVVRSLLKQNTELSFEKDSLNVKVESLTSALDHLTGLLRNLQNANIESSKSQQQVSPGKAVSINGGGHGV